jgi:hypothetical protein
MYNKCGYYRSLNNLFKNYNLFLLYSSSCFFFSLDRMVKKNVICISRSGNHFLMYRGNNCRRGTCGEADNSDEDFAAKVRAEQFTNSRTQGFVICQNKTSNQRFLDL